MLGFIEKFYGKLEKEMHPVGRKSILEPILAANITTRCNFNCSGCTRNEIDDGKKIKEDLPLEVFEKFLREGKKIDAKKINFTGGEPILHPNFREMVALAEKYDYFYTIVSNGWIHKEYADIIKVHRRKFFIFTLSLDGATAEIHDILRNKPGSFDRVIKSIRYYVKNGIKVSVNVCLNSHNFCQMEKIMELCVDQGVSYVRWLGYVPFDESDKKTLSYGQRIEAMKKIASLQRKFGRKCMSDVIMNLKTDSIDYKGFGSSKPINYCEILNGSNFYLDYEGKLVFCCESNKKLENSPSLEKDGFERCSRIMLDTMNNLKKERLKKVMEGKTGEDGGMCIFCNKHAQECLDKAIAQNKIKQIAK